MKRPARAVAIGTATVLAGVTAIGVSASAATAASSSSASSAATHKVIVLLKDQPASAPKNSPAFATRQSRIASSQAAVAKQLRATSKNVKQYKLVNAVAATVSSSELAALRSNSAVASVIPDSVIHGPTPTATSAATGPTRTPPPNTCSTGKPMLEPEALQVTNTASDDPSAKTARSLGVTGAGVKVAWMAEGIDINNPDFIRADGSHVFVDYQDFSGDGTAAPTDGAEAFLDASAIAAQGRHTYNVQNFTAVPLTTACNIRIEGMAPGASLVGLKVFGQNNATLTSGFLQAIDYAVSVDKVDVLNQSFGGNPIPETAADAVRQFDEAAVAAGVTVTVSSGDAGPTNTIGSPATDPAVISVGGSTTYKFYAQTGYGGYYPLAKDGWIDNNVSPLSSSGFTQSGRTIDLLAPGDADWALCSTDQTIYAGCSNFAGGPSPVEETGGTSESAPLTAGAAALVIQAYRSTHGGASPSPAEVKQLLTGTAADVDHPAQEQGAGLLDSYQAVLAARSLHDANGSPARTGSSILTSPSQLDGIGLPGSSHSWRLTLTNNGAGTQTLKLGQRTIGDPFDVQKRSVKLSDSGSKHFTDYAGQTTNYEVTHFTVPKGADRLDEDYVYPGDPNGTLNARVRVALIDPNGKFASHSIPQGVGNAGHADVANPAAGTWTAMVWSRQSTVGGTVGTVKVQFALHDYHSTGSVTPSSVTLASGASAAVTVTAKTPGTAGDAANSVTIASSSGQDTTVPVSLRSEVNIGQGGRYSGTLTGGNGRSFFTGQTSYLQFDVPAAQRDITANFRFANGDTDPVYGYLVDPSGNAQAFGADRQVTGFDSTGNATIAPVSTMSLYTRAPAAGRWTLVLLFAPAVSGQNLAVPFSGNISLNTVKVSSSGVPNANSATLKAGKAVTVPVTITNTGVAAASYFVDARFNRTATVNLPLNVSTVTLPLKPTDPFIEYNVPTETSSLTVDVNSTRNVAFDTFWMYGFGDPDVAGTSTGHSATATLTGSPVANGPWIINPSDVGPYGANPAPAATATMSVTASILAFDKQVTTPIGDFEQSAVDPNAQFGIITVPAGKSVTIPVTITPSGAKGTVVSGQLFVDNLSLISGLTEALGGLTPGAQELSTIPYRYTIG